MQLFRERKKGIEGRYLLGERNVGDLEINEVVVRISMGTDGETLAALHGETIVGCRFYPCL